MSLVVNGDHVTLDLEPRTSLLDALREHLALTGTKKGCNQGACGACTVLVDGRRVLGCLTLAMQAEGRTVTTIEGIDADGLPAAVVRHDGLQCGYCTPGQVCSALGMLAEARSGAPSLVTEDLASDGPVRLTAAEVRERMSGNLCRCGAYNGLVDAILEVADSDPDRPEATS